MPFKDKPPAFLVRAILYKFRQISLLNQDSPYSGSEINRLNWLLDKEFQTIKKAQGNFKKDIFLQNFYDFLVKIFLYKLSEKKQEVFELYQIHKNLQRPV